MINQFVFLFGLQSLGMVALLPFRKRLPLPFCLLSSLLWGALLWTVTGVCLLVFGLPFTLLNMLILLGVFATGVIFVSFRTHPAGFQRSEIYWLVGWLVLSGLIFALSSLNNLAMVSVDSYYIFLNGRAFTTDGLADFMRTQIALRGVMLMVLQAAAPFLGASYVYSLQPAITGGFAFLFMYQCMRLIGVLKQGQSFHHGLIVLAFTSFASTYYLIFQTFYIHTNFLSGIYLLVGITSLWFALHEQNHTWLIPGVAALVAFSLLRTESPLFALVFLFIFLSYPEVPFRQRLYASHAFALPLTVWYVYILFGIGSGTYILNAGYTLLIIAALLSVCLFAWISYWDRIRLSLAPLLPRLMVGGVILAIIALIILDPNRMQNFFSVQVLNMASYGLWGKSWFILFGLGLVALARPVIPYERLFTYGFLIFFLLLYAVSTRNVSPQLDWGDSANRILTHIYPTLFFYLAVKYSIDWPANADHTALQRNRRLAIISVGLGLILTAVIRMVF